MKDLFFEASIQTSRLVTRLYSTSFSLGVRMLNRRFRDPIYAIYGFVRFADEIVDTFQNYDKKLLLDQFREDTYKAIRSGISLNPVLNSFQWVVNKIQDCLNISEQERIICSRREPAWQTGHPERPVWQYRHHNLP